MKEIFMNDYGQMVFQMIENLSEHSNQKEQIQDEIRNLLEIMQSTTGGKILSIYLEENLLFQHRVKQLFESESKSSESEQEKEKRMQKIDRYVALHYQDAIQLEEVARHVGMSRRNFCRFFSESQNDNFTNYLNQRRIEMSIPLLKNSAGSIADVAYRCGFSSPAYFGKIFKKMKGKTPGMYRKMTNI